MRFGDVPSHLLPPSQELSTMSATRSGTAEPRGPPTEVPGPQLTDPERSPIQREVQCT